MWELRAAVSLAHLWRAEGKRAQAHDLLAPICDWFTEGFTNRDVVKAGQLLHALGEPEEAMTVLAR
jgi:hypothetical protein